MPANLTPQYHAAEEKFKRAGTAEEKMKALQEMMAVIPKHKGTEKLQADIRKRIARLKEEGAKKKQTRGFNPFGVEKQGAGQVVLVGYPNSGKSALVGALSRAKVKVADYPYTTTLPVTGMMPYQDTYISWWIHRRLPRTTFHPALSALSGKPTPSCLLLTRRRRDSRSARRIAAAAAGAEVIDLSAEGRLSPRCPS